VRSVQPSGPTIGFFPQIEQMSKVPPEECIHQNVLAKGKKRCRLKNGWGPRGELDTARADW
jgi:hypothetical protein